ncbi:MAG: hypothetical protein RIQ89_663, partial [Bacteroidota bacterium]
MRFYFLLLFIALQSINAPAQIIFNEVQPANVFTYPNGYGEYKDWIEIYNAGGSAVNLQNYKVSDKLTEPNKFIFPSLNLGAGERTILFCDDEESKDLTYSWEMAVMSEENWKYRANTTAPPDTNWRNLSFNDAAWNSGNLSVGWGDGDDATTVSTCISVYLRKTFTITDTSRILGALLTLDYDDGYAIYLNGVELSRNYMSGNAATRPVWNAVSMGSHEANRYRYKEFDWLEFQSQYIKSLLKPGTNVLAYEVHNASATEGDLTSFAWLCFKVAKTGPPMFPAPLAFISARYPSPVFCTAGFKLKSTGESLYLFNASSSLIDQVTFGSMDFDHAYARSGDANAQWCYIANPTPNAANSSGTCATN